MCRVAANCKQSDGYISPDRVRGGRPPQRPAATICDYKKYQTSWCQNIFIGSLHGPLPHRTHKYPPHSQDPSPRWAIGITMDTATRLRSLSTRGGVLRLPGPVLYPYPLADICGSVDPCSARSFGVTVWLRTWLLGPWLLGRVRLRIWAALASQRFATKAPADSTL